MSVLWAEILILRKLDIFLLQMSFKGSRSSRFEHSLVGIDWISFLQIKNQHVSQQRSFQTDRNFFKNILKYLN